ncbi:type I restriction enzyme HsdR N-terminal domain-containing protein [Thermodesulfovibrio sp.]|uniref:type I restriction enzyme HsdR N-terminal domain-containing protein n=1 Tax=Thermodesulfovibrio sp. TaxID=2067987 RepID=UPI003C7C2CA1
MYLPLNKTPDSPEERKELIGDILKQQEELFAQSIGYIQRLMIQYLIERGYTLDNIELNRGYEVVVSEKEKFITSVDILIRLQEKVLYAIKCTPASIESWERFMLAFCRVVEPYQIPFAMVTDGRQGRLINILTGEVKETMDIPKKEDLFASSLKFMPYPSEKLPKEKRILYAFDAIKCCPTCNI